MRVLITRFFLFAYIDFFCIIKQMKHIANIITNQNFTNSTLYNVTDNINTIDKSFPTLIIGWDNVKKYFPNASCVDWKIKDNVFWTFGNRERRDKYEIDLLNFNNKVISDYSKSIKYTFINIFEYNDNKKLKLLSRIRQINNGVVFVDSDVIFLCVGDKEVFGISLLDWEYSGGNKTDLADAIKSNKNITIKNTSDINYSVLKLFENNKYVIPSLFFN